MSKNSNRKRKNRIPEKNEQMELVEQLELSEQPETIVQIEQTEEIEQIHRRKSNMSEMLQDRVVNIKVIGIGGAGNNVINRMI